VLGGAALDRAAGALDAWIMAFDSSTVLTSMARRSNSSRPNCEGLIWYSLISPLTSSPTMVGPEIEISSRPSRP